MAKEYFVKFGIGEISTTSGLAPTFTHFVNMATGGTLAPPGITQLIVGIGLYKFAYDPTAPIAFEIDGATTGLGTNRYVHGVLDPTDKLDETATALGSTLVAIGNTTGGIGVTLVAQGSTIVGIGATLVATGSTVVGIGNTLLATGSTIVGIGNTTGAIGVTLIAQGSTIVGIGNTLADINTNADEVLLRLGSTSSSFGDTSTDPGNLFGYVKRIQELLEGNSDYTKATGVWLMYNRGGATLLRSKTMADTSTTVTKT